MNFRSITALLVSAFLTACAAGYGPQGNAQLQAGNLNGARSLYEQALRNGEDAGAAWTNLGVIAGRQGQLDLAVRDFEMGARYGNPLAQEYLVKLGKAVPTNDLAQRNDSDGGAAVAAAILSGASGYQAGRAAGYGAPALVQPARQPFNCTSQVIGQNVNTNCR